MPRDLSLSARATRSQLRIERRRIRSESLYFSAPQSQCQSPIAARHYATTTTFSFPYSLCVDLDFYLAGFGYIWSLPACGWNFIGVGASVSRNQLTLLPKSEARAICAGSLKSIILIQVFSLQVIPELEPEVVWSAVGEHRPCFMTTTARSRRTAAFQSHCNKNA